MPKRFKLEGFPCPVCSNGRKSSWVCESCDGDAMYVDDAGYMECENQNHRGKLRQWHWRCSDARHNGRYLPADREGWTSAIVNLPGKTGSNWVIRLIKELTKQFTEESDSDSECFKTTGI